ncbi:hypothetical protein M3Y97_00964000 [Aphelenchoides bicaudatus]|nr:hypothetical protein M3Y97_00964000 [Aphelenchoides bicaudatus]
MMVNYSEEPLLHEKHKSPKSYKLSLALDHCINKKWILGTLFTLLIFAWIHLLVSNHLESPEKARFTEDGQEILWRDDCTIDGFDTQSIINVNSHTLPSRSWTYDSNTGICEGEDAKNCLPGFHDVKLSHEYTLSKATKSIHCVVQKSMSRLFRTLACFLNDPLAFFYEEKDIIKDAYVGKCSLVENPWEYGPDWLHAMIIRDPVERFLSGFTHICLLGKRGSCIRFCEGCGSNMTCFLEKQLQKTWETARGEREMDVEMRHTMPQTWFCELGQHFKNYTFLRYNSDSQVFFDQEIGPYLKSRNISELASNYIRKRMISTRTSHSTTGFELKDFLEQRVRKSPYLMEMIIRLFYHDYKAFNFMLPTVTNC